MEIIFGLGLLAGFAYVAHGFSRVTDKANAKLRSHFDSHPEEARSRELMRLAGYRV
jgi:hypothetical protein